MEKKIPFAPVVMLIDASYLDRVGSDMSAHFAPIVNRELPKAIWLTCWSALLWMQEYSWEKMRYR